MPKPKKQPHYATEAAMCADFIDQVDKRVWTAYPETAGFDILLVRKADGLQIGIEAKKALNAEVINQILPSLRPLATAASGPDHRAVLVPKGGTGRLSAICDHIGITVITIGPKTPWQSNGYSPDLPTGSWSDDRWYHWCPAKRCAVPEFIPDVSAGVPAPVKLTDWKVKAIKLAIVLEERPVSRHDLQALNLSASRWLDRHSGYLMPTPAGYVPSRYMPDFKAQHPRNYDEIKAKRSIWDWGAPPAPVVKPVKAKKTRKRPPAAEHQPRML